jgi:hypothetical protein
MRPPAFTYGQAAGCTIAAMNPLSGVLDEAWRMYKAHAKHLLAIAFIIYLGAAIIAAFLALAGTIGLLLGAFVELVAAFLLQATLVKAVQDVRDGRADLSVSETVSAATPSLWPVAGASILAGIAITIGLFLFIIPGLWLITIWAVIVPVIVIERAGVFASFGRSQELVRGRFWHVFATLALVLLIMLVVDIVLTLIFAALPHFLRGGLSSIIAGTLISPYLALVVTLVYYRLSAQPAAGGPYGAYQQTPQDSGTSGGFTEPPQGTGTAGGSQPSPPSGETYGGSVQAPQDSGTYEGSPGPPPSGGSYGEHRQSPRDGGVHEGPQQSP